MESQQVSFPATGVLGTGNTKDLRIIALLDPVSTKAGKPMSQVDPGLGVRIGARGVIHRQRRIFLGAMAVIRGRESDLSIRDAQGGTAAIDVTFFRCRIG